MAWDEQSRLLWKRPALGMSVLLSIALLGLMAWLRLSVFPHRVLPVAYGVPLLICIWFRRRSILWGMVAGFTVITAIKYYLVSSADMDARFRQEDWILVLADLMTVGVVVHLLITALHTLETRTRALARLNSEVEQKNREMELAAQESARQRDLLQALMELSRSIGSEGARQVMDRICMAVGPLLGDHANAAAILQYRDGNLIARGYWGFGDSGPARTKWSAQKSFARQVIESGQTQALEDIAARADLDVLQPRNGPRFASLLAVPMRLRGQIIGTFEVFSHQKRSWTPQQVQLMEWLAANASVLLETATLVETIERTTRRLETVIATMPIGVIIANADLSDIRANAAAAQLFGVQAGVNLVPLSRWKMPERYVQGKLMSPQLWSLGECLREGKQVRNHEVELVYEELRRSSVLISASPIRDAGGAIVGAVAAYVDINPQKRLQQQLDERRRQAEEVSIRKSRFLAAVSHDIRTPANAIGLLAELIGCSVNNRDMQNELPDLVSQLQTSAVSLVNLVSDVLDVTRFDTGHVDLQETDFSLPELVKQQITHLRPLAVNKNLECVWKCDGDVVIRADKLKLTRILSNLIGNAIKYTEQGEVSVGCAPADQNLVKIEVRDTGVGIPADHLDQIFDEFFQLRNPSRDRNQGTGLGLAICRRLVQAMNGQLSVTSTVGQGSCFTVLLPIGRGDQGDATQPDKKALE